MTFELYKSVLQKKERGDDFKLIKSMFKRSWLSITRKLSKTVILAIVMFVMANLVLASIAIKNAVGESTKFAKESLGSSVYLMPDMDKIREEAHQNAMNNNGGGPIRMAIQRPSIYLNMVETIAESNYLKDYTYGITETARETNFEAIDNGMSGGGGGGMMASIFGNISIVGINSYAFIDEVQNKKMELINGTYFDEKTNDKVIISNELAELNNLKVGDKIKLTHEERDMENFSPRNGEEPKLISSETYELVIIGIYDVNTNKFNGNTIYMNVLTAAKFLREDQYADGNFGVDNIVFFLNNPEDADKFIEEANNKFPDMADNNLKLDINRADYEQMAGPIEQVGSFADTVLWIVIIASVLIITLIINNNIKDRKYEIGVLMSLGGTKKNIIGSILLELVIIGTVGFILSIGTSCFLANSMGKSMLEKQLLLAEEQTQNNYGRPGPGGQMNSMTIGGGPIGIQSSNVDAIDKIDISVGTSDYAILFLIGYLISGMAMVIPAINIVKYEPKTILTGRQ